MDGRRGNSNKDRERRTDKSRADFLPLTYYAVRSEWCYMQITVAPLFLVALYEGWQLGALPQDLIRGHGSSFVPLDEDIYK